MVCLLGCDFVYKFPKCSKPFLEVSITARGGSFLFVNNNTILQSLRKLISESQDSMLWALLFLLHELWGASQDCKLPSEYLRRNIYLMPLNTDSLKVLTFTDFFSDLGLHLFHLQKSLLPITLRPATLGAKHKQGWRNGRKEGPQREDNEQLWQCSTRPFPIKIVLVLLLRFTGEKEYVMLPP